MISKILAHNKSQFLSFNLHFSPSHFCHGIAADNDEHHTGKSAATYQ
jgi:hypothetical protein